MKNVVGLNVHQVSSCWEHAKGLTTMVFLVCAAMLLILHFSLASSQLNFFVLRSRKDDLGFSAGWFVGAFLGAGVVFFPFSDLISAHFNILFSNLSLSLAFLSHAQSTSESGQTIFNSF